MPSLRITRGSVGFPKRRLILGAAVAAGVVMVLTTPAFGEQEASSTATPPPATEETIEVTATRLPEDILDVPTSITIVTGEELAPEGPSTRAWTWASVSPVGIRTSSALPARPSGPAFTRPRARAPFVKKLAMLLREREAPIRRSPRSRVDSRSWAKATWT